MTVKWGGDPDNSAGQITLKDTTSQASYGVRHRDIDALFASSSEAKAFGEYLLARDAQPRTRITDMTILPSADDRLWPAALGLKPGDRVQVKILPQNVGSRVTVDCFVEGIEHSVSSGINEWRTKYLLSAVSASDVAGYWVWGTSQWGGADMRWYL